jgi:thiamine monophosphate synthase
MTGARGAAVIPKEVKDLRRIYGCVSAAVILNGMHRLNRTEAEADHVQSGQKDKLLRTNFG